MFTSKVEPTKVEYIALVLGTNIRTGWKSQLITNSRHCSNVYESGRAYPSGVPCTATGYAPYDWAQWARVLHYTTLEMLSRDKQSSLLYPFFSYEENEVL